MHEVSACHCIYCMLTQIYNARELSQEGITDNDSKGRFLKSESIYVTNEYVLNNCYNKSNSNEKVS